MRVHAKAVFLVEVDGVVAVDHLDFDLPDAAARKYRHRPVHQGLAVFPAAALRQNDEVVELARAVSVQVDLAEADDPAVLFDDRDARDVFFQRLCKKRQRFIIGSARIAALEIHGHAVVVLGQGLHARAQARRFVRRDLPQRRQPLFKQHELHTGDTVKRARHDADLGVAELLIEAAGARIARVRVDAKVPAAVREGIALVKCRKLAAKAARFGLGVDDERVQHHDLAVRRVIAPVRPRVGIDLRLVENGRADDLTVLLLHEKVAARERGLRCLTLGIHAALPADRGLAALLCRVDLVVNAAHRVQIRACCLADRAHASSATASAMAFRIMARAVS